MNDPTEFPRRRSIRSYVVRAGRMTDGQQRAMAVLWPRFGVPYDVTPLDLDALFGRRARRVLEIGFGNGDHLASMAAANPDTDFLGVEVHPPGVGHLLQEVERLGLTNVRVIRHDAIEVLTHPLPPASLDELQLLFPDPWHKKRHHKRRIVQPAFLDLVAGRLKVGGVLRMATDWQPYAEHMLETLRADPRFVNLSVNGDYVARDESRAPTRFERRGERLGHAVFDFAFRRRDADDR
jgi:tRNA (guanine-N7-)-methyltransferase